MGPNRTWPWGKILSRRPEGIALCFSSPAVDACLESNHAGASCKAPAEIQVEGAQFVHITCNKTPHV